MKFLKKVCLMTAVMSFSAVLLAFAGDKPTDVTIAQSGSDLTVSWVAPDYDGVDQYKVQIFKKASSDKGNDSPGKSQIVDSEETSVDFTVSTKGYYYAKVRVRDVNNKWHDWSNASNTVIVKSEDISSGSSGTSGVIYTQNYTGSNTSYNSNGTNYNTLTYGPTVGNLATTGLTTLSDPNAMNPTTNGVYSSSSSVVNTKTVAANTYTHAGWQYEANGMWYLNSDGTYPVSTWKYIDDAFYHFNPNGWLEVNTWVLESNQKWRFVGADAKMVRGWNLILGKWYYFSMESGELQGPGVIEADGKYYYIEKDGSRAENKIIDGNYFGADGALNNG